MIQLRHIWFFQIICLTFLSTPSLALIYTTEVTYDETVYENQETNISLEFELGASPDTFNDLLFWFDAGEINISDTNQVRIDGSDIYVKNWTEISGFGDDMNQTINGTQPLYQNNSIGGRPGVFFSGDSSKYLCSPSWFSASDTTSFYVLNFSGDKASGTNVLISFAESFKFVDGQFKVTFGAITRTLVSEDLRESSFILTVSDNVSVTTRYYYPYLNGVSKNNESNTRAIRYSFCMGSLLNGSVSEVIMFNRQLNGSEREAVENYLTSKYFPDNPTNYSLNTTLVYNNESVQVSSNYSQGRFISNITVRSPIVENNNTNISLYWNYELYENDSLKVNDSTNTSNQSVLWSYLITETQQSIQVMEGQEFDVYMNVSKQSFGNATLSGTAFFGSYPTTIPPSDVYSYWKLDESAGSGISDSTTNDRNGTLTGTYYWTESGKLNNALNLTGAGYGVFGDIADFSHNDSFSVDGWIRTSTIEDGIICKQNGSGWSVYLSGTGKIIFSIKNTSITNEARRVSSGTVTDGAWHYIAVTYDGSSDLSGLHIYIDGELSDGTTGNYDTLTGTIHTEQPAKIGILGSYLNYRFVGLLDDFAIYTTELDPEQITERYGAGYGRELDLNATTPNGTYFTMSLLSENETMSQFMATIYSESINSTSFAYNLSYILSIESDGNTINRTYEESILVRRIGIEAKANGTACSTEYVESMMLYVKEETNSSTLNFTTEIVAYIATDHVERTFGLSHTTAETSQKICISPTFGNVSANLEITYTRPSYVSRQYFFEGYLTNISQDLTMYLRAEDADDVWTFIVLSSGLEVEGARIDAYRYYPSTTSSLLVDSRETNTQGKALMTLYSETVKYHFIVTVDGVTRINTTPSFLIGDDRTITFNIDPTVQSLKTILLGIDFNCSTSSQILSNLQIYCNVSDRGDSVDTFKFVVFYSNILNGSSDLCEATSTNNFVEFSCTNLSVYNNTGRYTYILSGFSQGEEILISTDSATRGFDGFADLGGLFVVIVIIFVPVAFMLATRDKVFGVIVGMILSLMLVAISGAMILVHWEVFCLLLVIGLWLVMRR